MTKSIFGGWRKLFARTLALDKLSMNAFIMLDRKLFHSFKHLVWFWFIENSAWSGLLMILGGTMLMMGWWTLWTMFLESWPDFPSQVDTVCVVSSSGLWWICDHCTLRGNWIISAWRSGSQPIRAQNRFVWTNGRACCKLLNSYVDQWERPTTRH